MNRSATLINYRVRTNDRLVDEQSVAAVFVELAGAAPNLAYLCARSGGDDEAFTHIVSGDVDQLRSTAAFQQFQATLPRRLDGNVSREDAGIVGLHLGRDDR